MKFSFQPDSGDANPERLDLVSPIKRCRRRLGGALTVSLMVHGAALAAVVLNPARFFEFTGEDGGAPGENLFLVSFADPSPLADDSEVAPENPASSSKVVRDLPVREAPEFAGSITAASVVASAGEPMIETSPDRKPLAFLTADALTDLPPGYELPAEPEPASSPPKPAASKPAASKSNTSTVPRPGAAGPFTEAKVKRRMGVRYPDDARREGVEGSCLVEIVINAAGKVTSAKVSKSSGDARLDREALRAAKSATFHAARRGDTPVASRARMPFQFVIH